MIRHRQRFRASAVDQETPGPEGLLRAGAWEWDIANNSFHWSDALRCLFGREQLPTPSKLSDHLALLSPASPRLDAQSFRQALEAGRHVEFEARIVRPDGRQFWSWNRCVGEVGPSGSVALVRGVVQDITQHKTAEHARNQLANLIDAVPQGVITADMEGRITAWNHGAEQLYGYTAEEVVGRSIEILAPPGRQEEPMNLLRRIRAGESTVRVKTARLRQDGGCFECWLSIGSIKGELGENVGVFAIVDDVTKAEQTTRDLQERDTQFRALVDQGVAGVYVLSAEGRIRYVNAGFARVLGYSPEEVFDHSLLEFTIAEDRDAVQAGIQATLAGRNVVIESRVVARDGRIQHVLGQGTRVQYEGHSSLIGVVIDVTDRQTSEVALQRVNRLLKTMIEGNEVLVRSTEEDALAQKMCQVLVTVGGYDTASIALIDANGAVHTFRAPDEQPAGIPHAEPPACPGADVADVIRRGEPDIQRASGWARLPLKNHSGCIGCLGVQSHERLAFEADEIALLNELANDLAYGIVALRDRAEREAFRTQLQHGMEDTVGALAATLEMRDPYTAGHQARVAQLAVVIAREMGLEEPRIHAIHVAAIVHDIGKIKIPSELLTKPGRLTPVEEQLMETHAEAGYDILKGITFPWPIAEIVHQHHERMDGSGYPHGLRGADIHMEARILAVADVVEAMSSDRPYRFGAGLGATMGVIEAGRGTLYDPDVVDACLVAFHQNGFAFTPATHGDQPSGHRERRAG